jgi:hypothetical protein
MAQFDLNRAQGPQIATLKLNEITPKNWHKYPPRAANSTPIYVATVSYSGGVKGDDVDTATANSTTAYTPRTQAEKAQMNAAAVPGGGAVQLGKTIVQDVGSPRGWIEPQEPYGPAPVSPTDDPTITSLSPNTAVSGGTPTWVAITGTKFTPFSQVETGGIVTPYSRYRSPTRIDMLQDPRSSAGTVVVKVIDHGVKSAGSNFTFT